MTQDEAKRMAARRALEFVEDGMLLGLGSGSTSRMFIEELGERVKQGLRVRGIATSTASRQLAESLSIPIITFDDSPVLDLAVDGADEVTPCGRQFAREVDPDLDGQAVTELSDDRHGVRSEEREERGSAHVSTIRPGFSTG